MSKLTAAEILHNKIEAAGCIDRIKSKLLKAAIEDGLIFPEEVKEQATKRLKARKSKKERWINLKDCKGIRYEVVLMAHDTEKMATIYTKDYQLTCVVTID